MTRDMRQAAKSTGAGLVAALLAILASVLLKHNEFSFPVRVLVSLLPIPAYAVLFVVIIRGIRDMDEMQRHIQLEAAAICLISTAMIAVTYGFLGMAGIPQANWAFIVCLMAVLYSIGYFVAYRHYR